LKEITRNMIGGNGVVLCGAGYGKMAVCYECRGKVSSAMKRGEFPDYIRECWLLKRDSVSWS